MANNGADILLLVNTGTIGTPVYTAVGSQKDVSFSEERDLIDTSDKSSANKTYLYGKYGSTVDLDALFVNGDAGMSALRTALRNGTTLLIRRQFSGSATEGATCLVSSLSEAHPDADASTVSCSVTITGAWAAV